MEDKKPNTRDRDVRRKEIIYRLVNAEGKPVMLTALHIDDEDVIWLVKLLEKYPYIKSVNLSANRISNASVKHLVQNKTLRELDVSFNGIDDRGMKAFCKSQTLLNLTYSPYDVGFTARTKIIAMLERNRIIANMAENSEPMDKHPSLWQRLRECFHKQTKSERDSAQASAELAAEKTIISSFTLPSDNIPETPTEVPTEKE